MKGVAQNDLGTHLVQRLRHHALDRAIGAHRHEDGRLHDAVVQGQLAAPGATFGFQEFKLQHAGTSQVGRSLWLFRKKLNTWQTFKVLVLRPERGSMRLRRCVNQAVGQRQ